MGEGLSSEPEAIHLRLLGQPQVQDAKGRVHLLERRDAAMLALLALDGPQSRSSLAQHLWPDVALPKALTSLRQRIFRMRRLTGHALVVEAGALQLAPGVAHDAHPESWAAAGQEQALLAGQHYAEGDLLDESVQRLRQQWQLRRSDRLAQESSRLEAQGDLQQALLLAERLLGLQETSEHAHRRCMRLHYLMGDRGQALAAFARCREKLMTLVGVTPDHETRQLAGLIEASELSRPALADSRLQVALTRPPRLAGRQAAWAQMQDAWLCGRPVVLRGEAGIGKTRLAHEFTQAQGPADTVKAERTEANSPYALLARLLQRLLPQLPAPAAWVRGELARLVPQWGPPPLHPAEPLRIRQSVTEVLTPWAQAGQRRLLLDDLQWADAASLEALLAFFAQVGGATPALLICLRDAEVPATLQQWIQAHRATAVLDLKLGPLDAAGLRELLVSLELPGLPEKDLDRAAATLLHQTGGHPFVLLELLRSVPDAWRTDRLQGPVGLAHVQLMTLLGRRLLQLPPPARSLAQLAAVAGPSFSAALAAAVFARTEVDLVEPWRLLMDAQMIQPHGQMFDVVREAALLQIPQPIARGLHERVALFLQGHGGPSELLAGHWKAAHRWQSAATAFGQAAQAARLKARADEELSHWDEAMACLALSDPDAASWEVMRSAVAVALNVEGAEALIARTGLLLQAACDDGQRLEALLFLARVLIDAGREAQALEQAQAALRLARSVKNPLAELDAVAWCALALALNGQALEGLALLQTQQQEAERWAHVSQGLNYFGSLGYVRFVQGDYLQALPALSRAADLAEQLGRLGDACEQTSSLSTCFNMLGRQTEAVREGERALQFWRRMGAPQGLTGGAIHTQLASHYAGAGRLGQALEMLDWAKNCFVQTGSATWQLIAEHRLSRVYLQLGQAARARQALSPLPAVATAGHRVTRSVIEARIALRLGCFDLARLKRETSPLLADLTPMDRRALLLFKAAVLPAPEALELAQQVLFEAAAQSDPTARVHALGRVARAWADLGQGTLAKRHARLAWAALATSVPLDISHTSFCNLVHGAALAGSDQGTADAAVRSAMTWIQQARPHVPEPYWHSFCELNPDHRQLLVAGQASGATW